MFARLADLGAGRDQRFADPGFWVQGLPEPTLPTVCAAHAALADPSVRTRLCSARDTLAADQSVPRLPLVLTDALSRIRQAFLEPVRKAEARSDELKLQQREGLGELRGLSDAIASIEAQTRPFVERFHLTLGRRGGSGAGDVRRRSRRIRAGRCAARR